MRRAWQVFSGIGLVLCASQALAACNDDGDAANWCSDLTSGTADVRANGRFGSAFATGDYNADGFVDLAIGRPDGPSNHRGDVVVLLGTADLPDGSLPRDVVEYLGHSDAPTLGVDSATGTSLATVDLDRDLIDDLVVGSPGQDVPFDFAGCGSVATPCLDTGVLSGYFGFAFSEIQLSDNPPTTLDSLSCGSPGDADNNYFGATLVANRDGDIYAGAPGIGLNTDETAGYVSGFGDAFVSPDCIAAYRPPTLFGEVNANARVGAALAAINKGSGNNATVVFGAPNADNGSLNELGVVLVQYASNTTTNPPASAFVQEAHWPPSGNGQGDHFGAAIAAGDFDGDGDDDVAVAAPDKDIAGENDAGRVYLLRNDADLLRPVAGGILQQSSFGFGSEAGDRFGAALAAGYIDGDRFEDLVVGVPGEETTATPVSNEGFVAVIFGSASGLTTGSTYIHFREPDLGGVSTANANFGSVLAVSDLNRDGLDEIIIGVPTRDVDGENNAGIVYMRVGRQMRTADIFSA